VHVRALPRGLLWEWESPPRCRPSLSEQFGPRHRSIGTRWRAVDAPKVLPETEGVHPPQFLLTPLSLLRTIGAIQDIMALQSLMP
jgi:hypothetical protein